MHLFPLGNLFLSRLAGSRPGLVVAKAARPCIRETLIAYPRAVFAPVRPGRPRSRHRAPNNHCEIDQTNLGPWANLVRNIHAYGSFGRVVTWTKSPIREFFDSCPGLEITQGSFKRLDSKGAHVHLRQRACLFGLVAMEDIIALEARTLGRRLSSVPLLSGLDESALVALESELKWLSVPGGATLFYEDQIPDALYVVISGCLGVTVRGTDGGEMRVARCQAGDTVGEMGLLGGGRRSATVRALRDTVLLRLERCAFERLVGRHPPLMPSIVSQLVHRLRTTTRRGRDEAANRTVALLPVGQDVDHRVISRALAEQLASGGERIELLDSESSVHTAEWFNEVEARSDKVLYCAEPANSAWT